jgi:hypothetical protein
LLVLVEMEFLFLLLALLQPMQVVAVEVVQAVLMALLAVAVEVLETKTQQVVQAQPTLAVAVVLAGEIMLQPLLQMVVLVVAV